MIIQDSIQLNLRQWFMRRTPAGATRQVAQLPLTISSDIGVSRTENQDRVGVLRAQSTAQKSFLVAVLCDGMGGMVAGSECASISAAAFLSGCIHFRNLEPAECLKKAAENANAVVNDEYQGKGGATLSAFFIDNESNFIAINVGDSRIYYFSNDELKQLTEDDTFAGQIGEESSTFRNELLQYIGMGADLEPHIISIPELSTISQLLMTSDGVHFINKETLEAVVRHSGESKITAVRLVELAKWCGGNDNASVVVVEHLSSLLSTGDVQEKPSGTVEIWDAYGEVQLIAIEKTQVGEMKVDGKVDAFLPIVKSDLNHAPDSVNTPKIKKARKGISNKKTAKGKTVGKKPHVKINFK